MEINLKEKYLPVGTVVLLKGGKKRVMITGFCVVSPEIEKSVFDYCGCIYPEGYLSSAQNCLFNHEQIDKIYHVGLVDDEEIKFKAQLKEVSPQIDETFAQLIKKSTEVALDMVNEVEKDMKQASAADATVSAAPQSVAAAPVAQPAPQAAAEPSVINFLDENQSQN